MKINQAQIKQWPFYGALAIAGLIGGSRLAQVGKPTIKAPQAIYDFGVVEPGGDLTHSFEIQNTGQQPLRIKEINVSCGCIKDAHTKDTVVAPGPKTNLSVTWESASSEKSVVEDIEVLSNDPAHPVQVFTVKAKVESQVNILPAVANFGVVDADELTVSEPKEVVIKKRGMASTGDKVVVVSKSSFFKTTVEKSGSNKWKLKLALLPNAPVGPVDGEITVKPSWSNPIKLPILGQVSGTIGADPAEIYIETSASKAGKLVIRVSDENEKVTDVKIASAPQALKKFFKFKVERSRIDVSYDLTSSSAPRTVKTNLLVEVKISNGKSAKISIPITIAP